MSTITRHQHTWLCSPMMPRGRASPRIKRCSRHCACTAINAAGELTGTARVLYMEPSYAPLDLCVQRYRVIRQMFPMKDAAVSYGYTLCAKLPACAATVGGSDPLMRIPHCNCERVRSEDPDRRLGASPRST